LAAIAKTILLLVYKNLKQTNMKKLFVLAAAILVMGSAFAHEGGKKDKKGSKDKECCKKMEGKECGKKMDGKECGKKETKNEDATTVKPAEKKA
jgi:hypothetical protein